MKRKKNTSSGGDPIKMELSPITKYVISCKIYKYWLRDLIINKIKTENHYKHLLKITDDIFKDAVDSGKEKKHGFFR